MVNEYTVKVKKLHPDAEIPKYAKPGDCCVDLVAIEDVAWSPIQSKFGDSFVTVGNKAIVKTGIALQLPKGFEWQIRPRSGHAAKFTISVLNTPGTIDEQYTGEIMVILSCIGDPSGPFMDGIKKGMKIAQAKLSLVYVAKFETTDNLSETERGTGGLGSTGV